KSNLKRRFLCASFVMSTIFFVYRCFQREIFTHITPVNITARNIPFGLEAAGLLAARAHPNH
ncbi:hypothetical protein ACNSO8_00165, partial [Yersinia sp. LJYL362]|uniref:hypothetical protein n=1 Tax=Yersinia sp. LJYL362 TaxID=3402108 RepID=UPI003AB16324